MPRGNTEIGKAAKRASVKYRAYQKDNPNGTKKWPTFIKEEHAKNGTSKKPKSKNSKSKKTKKSKSKKSKK